ncbi:MAG: hypothetical protein KKA76_13675 [Proteobacteria bacterium]|nr:hypothetical protein [Pseudomonadota bacterium]
MDILPYQVAVVQISSRWGMPEREVLQILRGGRIEAVLKDVEFHIAMGQTLDSRDVITIPVEAENLDELIYCGTSTLKAAYHPSYGRVCCKKRFADVTTGLREVVLELSDLYVSRSVVMNFEKEHEITLNQGKVEHTVANLKGHIYESKELLIGIEAWSILYGSGHEECKKIRKKDIIKWLKDTHPELYHETIKRIATVVNPFKSGGATPSE